MNVSPTFSRHTVAGVGSLSGFGAANSGFGAANSGCGSVASGFSGARFNTVRQVSDALGNVYEMHPIHHQSSLNLSQNLPSEAAGSDPASLNAPPSSRAESLLTLQGIISASSVGKKE